MEDLTKQQVILMALLVSFVTSIATGIVTVSLMDQAPASVTQTINRVVERTIETVVQAPTQASVVTKETVVVKEDDLVVAAIEENTGNVVRFLASKEGSDVIALGLLISSDGLIAVDIGQGLSGSSYVVKIGGNVYDSERVFKTSDVVLFQVVTEDGHSFPHARLADSDKLKLGQTLVFIGGLNENRVETSLISSVQYEKVDEKSASSTPPLIPKVVGISADLDFSSSSGGILSNLSSEIIAFGVERSSGFVPSNTISVALAGYKASLSSTTPRIFE